MMSNIVTASCKGIKSMAREMLKGNYFKCVFIVMVCNILTDVPIRLLNLLSDNQIIETIIEVAVYIFRTALTLGMTTMYIKIARGEAFTLDNFTESFSLVWKGFVLSVIVSLYVVLWSFLLIIPGIICYYRLSQSFNILIDHPEYTPSECINYSKFLMQGNLSKFFMLTLSNFGWYLLAAVPGALHMYFYGPKIDNYIISFEVSPEQFAEALSSYEQAITTYQAGLVPSLLSLLMSFVTVYLCVAIVIFYDFANGNLVLSDEIIHTDETGIEGEGTVDGQKIKYEIKEDDSDESEL